MTGQRPLHHQPPAGGPPPRSGEERRRVKHRTLNAPDSTVRVARELRKGMSSPERLLSSELKQRPGGFKFRKQHPFGAYSMDFCCLEARLCIEVDGDAHDFRQRALRDERRDAALLVAGYLTLRVPAAEVFRNLEGVLKGIVAECEARRPLHHQPPAGGPPPRSGEEQE